jgi:hypothetical protein
VPDGVTGTIPDLGLNVGGAFTDDLDALSFGEALNVGVTLIDFDFSVDAAPANGGVTVGAPVPMVCVGPSPVNVTSEAALLEAQGDVFTWPAMPLIASCNMQATDELVSGLIAPNPAAPGIAPLDDMDALAEFTFAPGPCSLGAGTVASACSAYSVTAASPVLGGIAPDPVTLAAVTGATILAQPGTPPVPPALPLGCAGPSPCAAVGFPMLGLGPFDDIDGLCWFDVLANGAPDLPIGALGPGSAGDMYMLSLTPGSPSAPAFLGPAGIFRVGGSALMPTVPVPPAAMGLLPTDNIDGIICHSNDADSEGIPDFLDNCPEWPNPTQTLPLWSVPTGDSDCDGFPDAVTVLPRGRENFIGTDAADQCPTDAIANNELVDAWPPDINDNGTVNLSDVVAFAPWFNQIGPNPPNPLYNARFDLNASGSVNLSDVLAIGPFFNKSCTP